MSKILILSNHYNTLRIFRRELLKRLSSDGNEVIISLPPCDEENLNILKSYGCSLIITPEMERRGMNPFKDIKLLLKYLKLLKEVKPDKVITYTIKPNIYGSVACKVKKIPHYCNVTGLGSAFQAQGGMMRKLVSLMYKFSMNKASRIFFENSGSRDLLVAEHIVRKEQTVVMPGAGVNTEEFYPCEYPNEDNGINFLFVGRIMQEKGVDELFYAVKKIKSEFPNTFFDFIGWYEDDYKEIVENLEKDGFIRFHGFQPNVKPFIEKTHCSILPSHHEGMSNTLLECASMCKPLITNNIPGCKEAVIEGETGFLVEKGNADELYEAIKRFILLPHKEKKEMGEKGRKHMIECFEKQMVVEKTIKEVFGN